MFYEERKEKALAALNKAKEEYETIRKKAGNKTESLYSLRKGCAIAIKNVEAYITLLANTPQYYKDEVTDVQICISDFNYAVEFERDYLSGELKEGNVADDSVISTLGVTGTMAIATTFFVESTKDTIASFAGWRDSKVPWNDIGAAVAVGGGAMAFGALIYRIPFLAFFLPVEDIFNAFFSIYSNKKEAEAAEALLTKMQPEIGKLEKKLLELCCLYTETEKLLPAIDITTVCAGFPSNYRKFSDEQKLKLGALINATRAMGKLINRKIV